MGVKRLDKSWKPVIIPPQNKSELAHKIVSGCSNFTVDYLVKKYSKAELKEFYAILYSKK